MTITFIGHRDAPDHIAIIIKEEVTKLIENNGANTFYIGTHGNFDNIAHRVMHDLSKKYNGLQIYTVIAYMPTSIKFPDLYFDTVLPESVAAAIPKFAISKRNEWMIAHSDIVIAYVHKSFGGAAKAIKKATAKKKTIILIDKIST